MDFATKLSLVPVQHKCLLTLQEAARYSGLATEELQELISDQGCEFALYAGRLRFIKREKLEEFLDNRRTEEVRNQ